MRRQNPAEGVQTMKLAQICLTSLVVLVAGGSLFCLAQDKPDRKKVLLYSQSFGFRHSCVTRPLSGELSHGEKVFKEMATKAGLEVYFSQDFNDLRGDGDFNRFDAIVFYTSGAPPINREALMKWLRSGRAFVGIHCATDTFCDWPDYTRMINGCFKTHGPNDQPVTLRIEDAHHPSTAGLGKEWVISDEIYHFRDGSFVRDNCHLLTSVDTEKTNLEPQKMDKDKEYPVSWHREEGKGRVFYTSLGHREDVWTNPKWQQHVMGGLKWALGLAGANEQK